jgi:hypothetical protein
MASTTPARAHHGRTIVVAQLDGTHSPSAGTWQAADGAKIDFRVALLPPPLARKNALF